MEGDPEADVAWLDEDERATWILLAATLMKVPAALDAQLTRDAGLTFFEYMVLAVLSGRPHQRARMSTLAALANGSLSRLSHVARRLEGRGYLTRRPDPEDGRFTEALLTDAGQEALAAAAPGHVRSVRSLVFDGLDPVQRQALREACAAMLFAVDPEAIEAMSRLGALQRH